MFDNQQQLVALANARMPFGKYKGQLLVKIPEPYILWLKGQEIAHGKLAIELEQMMTIKLNGLESILEPLIVKQRF